jgi:hypothetical protein
MGDDIVEIYHTHDDLEADVIRDEVLAPQGITSHIRDRRSRPFPSAGLSGALYIAVASEQAEKARAALTEARSAGLISDGGDFIR